VTPTALARAEERTARRRPVMPRRRTPPADVIVAGRPRLLVREEDRESIADALAELLVDRLDRERSQHDCGELDTVWPEFR
jgi:hypothetical protein